MCLYWWRIVEKLSAHIVDLQSYSGAEWFDEGFGERRSHGLWVVRTHLDFFQTLNLGQQTQQDPIKISSHAQTTVLHMHLLPTHNY